MCLNVLILILNVLICSKYLNVEEREWNTSGENLASVWMKLDYSDCLTECCAVVQVLRMEVEILELSAISIAPKYKKASISASEAHEKLIASY